MRGDLDLLRSLYDGDAGDDTLKTPGFGGGWSALLGGDPKADKDELKLLKS